ncbi:peroxiredoxin [Corynebacterium glucuronolyticum]|uniref:thioredoxin-dependent peroxiredoxin n=1 Tax=Corynebacterium glucuronolyticum TaxID=39791 RepID=A0A7T4JVX5_9CORY|nr:peroxiredoxin [Corynebacterium glucuronolyticum]EEI27116.1 antioxidant, AhpC/TSA family [Corynebacterium glucuronolyticum ATCC 51867]QQB47358.1 peroxiredoxin [Corynebacterium glucuronolyticum]QRO82683.1 peroxiredoxin [Corynebacterium glucuronolyticum]WKD64309.1 Putative peroxiredoxin [Corynebacterium glucuronolyticum DSM 44120]SMB78379.1 peroxiredoxin Q/BCP [Corynebacterium glucuronolyticum]
MTKRLEQGDPAPTFTLADATGKDVSLPKKGTVIVYFYPRANTPGCTTEACDFRDNIESLGLPVYGISPDKPEKLAKFINDHGLNFTLLSDPDHEVATAYGAYGEKNNYGKKTMGIIRSTFYVVDGVIEHAWYNVRAKGHVDRVRRDLGL